MREDREDREGSVSDSVRTAGPSAGLSASELAALDAHWRAANYLAVGQIYLMANPLLLEPLAPEHIKPRLLGHWGTSPGLNLVYTHLNRVITTRDIDALCVWGPGHGGPAVLANSWLEGAYSETYPDVSRDRAGMERLFRQFSFPGGRAQPRRTRDPGLDPRGRRAGLFARPRLWSRAGQPRPAGRLCDRRRGGGDRPARRVPGTRTSSSTRYTTARSCRSCTSTVTRSPTRPCSPGCRKPNSTPCCADTDTSPSTSPATTRRRSTVPWPRRWTTPLDRIAEIQHAAREGAAVGRARLAHDRAAHAQGLDGPRRGRRAARRGDLARASGPAGGVRDNPDHLRQLEAWLRSYRPEELFDATAAPSAGVLACVPEGTAGWVRPRTPTAACCCGSCRSRPWSGSRYRWTNPARPCMNRPGCSATC